MRHDTYVTFRLRTPPNTGEFEADFVALGPDHQGGFGRTHRDTDTHTDVSVGLVCLRVCAGRITGAQAKDDLTRSKLPSTVLHKCVRAAMPPPNLPSHTRRPFSLSLSLPMQCVCACVCVCVGYGIWLT